MTLLTDWPTAWLMTGISVGIVFCILLILVLVLQLMGRINSHQGTTATATRQPDGSPCCCNSGKPSETDMAAVATAVHLYQNDLHDIESGVLTWHPTETGWHSELNPTL